MSTQNKAAAPDVLADFKVAPARKVQYEPVQNGPAPARVPSVSETATVHRGKRVRDGLPCVYVQDGAAQPFSLPLSAFGAAIAAGLISRDQITALLGD